MKTRIAFLFAALMSLIPSCLFAQDIDSLESTIKTVYGLSKLEGLNVLTGHYIEMSPRKALRYGRQAVTLGENLFVSSTSGVDYSEIDALITAYYQLGEVLYEREDYLDAQEYFNSANRITEESGEHLYDNEIATYLSDIQDRIRRGEVKENFFSRNFGDLKVGEKIREGSRDVKIKSEIGIARMYESQGEFNAAIEHYTQAINMLKDKGDGEYIAQLRIKVSVLLDSLEQYESASEYLTLAIEEVDSVEKINEIVMSAPVTGLERQVLQDSLKAVQRNLRALSEQAAKENDFEKSQQYYELYQELTLKMEADSIQMQEIRARQEDDLLKLQQQKNIADLRIKSERLEKQQAEQLRNALIVIAALVFLATMVVLYFYLSKRKQHIDLTIAYSDLETTKGKLEKAEKRIVRLLHQQVSGGVAEALISQKGEHPVAKKFVCVMFLDIRDFTPMAEKMNPEDLIEFQNAVFGFMIDAVERHYGTVNQLLGDGFMATFGAPRSHGNDCQHGYDAAMEILHELERKNSLGELQGVRVGIGLHAGEVVTGNVGNEARKQYSVTGNPVITASRVEQLNKQYQSQLLITEEVFQNLEKPLSVAEDFIDVRVKGRTEPVKILKIA